MKIITFIILSLFLIGCESNYVPTDTSKLKFKAGQLVKMKNNFYSDCVGMITGYSRDTNVSLGPQYSISIECPRLGKHGSQLHVLETGLYTAEEEK